jgi:hypothetical protein
MQNQTTRPEDELGREPDEAAPPTACNDSEFAGLDQLTADARALVQKLNVNDEQYVRLAVVLGSHIATAKKRLPGKFQEWCRDDLGRSPTWCANYRRLFEGREHLEPALKWAAETEHKWAYCRSVELLLKLVNEYKKQVCGAPDKPPRRRGAPDGVAALEKRVRGHEQTCVALFEALSPHWIAEAQRLAEAADDGPAKTLAELALRIRARADDPGSTCSATATASEAEGRRQGSEGAKDVDFLLDETLTQGVGQ